MDLPAAAKHSLPAATHLGRIELWASDPGALADFYAGVIGLAVMERGPEAVTLGAGGRELLRLVRKPGGRAYDHRTGLYHFCLAVPERRELGRLLRRLLVAGTPLQGLVDHRTAEAIYLSDPEGNGLELNWDRPRDTWPKAWSEMLRLGNGPLDTEGLLELADQAPGGSGRLPADAFLGHVHLHVADLASSRDFYHGVLGFDVMGEFPRQAVFTSAGGYHHHVAFNVWNGRGAPEPPEDATGLAWFSVVLPDAASLKAVLGRVKEAGLAAQETAAGWLVKDPSGNGVVLTA